MASVYGRSPVSSGTVPLGKHGEADPGPLTFQVIFICTANRARSPFAAALMRRHLGGAAVTVESFGAMEQGGAPALPGAVRAAQEFGIDLSRHRAQPLPPRGLRGSALAIGFEPFHVAAAVVVGGVERSRAFLLTELAEALYDSGAAERARDVGLEAVVALADDRRHARTALPRSIADPVGTSNQRFQEIFHDIAGLLALVAMRVGVATVQPRG